MSAQVDVLPRDLELPMELLFLLSRECWSLPFDSAVFLLGEERTFVCFCCLCIGKLCLLSQFFSSCHSDSISFPPYFEPSPVLPSISLPSVPELMACTDTVHHFGIVPVFLQESVHGVDEQCQTLLWQIFRALQSILNWAFTVTWCILETSAKAGNLKWLQLLHLDRNRCLCCAEPLSLSLSSLGSRVCKIMTA